MKTYNLLQKLISSVALIAIGAVMVLPIEAKVSSSGVTVKWIKKNYYSKKQANKRYYTNTQTKKNYWTKTQTDQNFYRKSYINSLISNYYTQTQVDALLASYLTTSNASSTYLTQSNAASSYLPLTGGTLTGGLTGTSINGTSFAYTSAQTRYKTIPARMFVPQSSASATSYTYTERGNAMYYGAGNAYPEAGFDLPDGAVITGLTLYSYDNSATSMSVSLEYADLLAVGATQMASVSSSGTSGSPGYINMTSVISNATVDNSTRYYHLIADISSTDSNLTFRAARISYTTTAVDTW